MDIVISVLVVCGVIGLRLAVGYLCRLGLHRLCSK